jgi:shikimate dehydrogenase
VDHSLSPRIHNAACAALGLDAVYLALRCGRDELPGLLRGVARAGGAGNVTVPHKAAAASLLDRPAPAVLRTGACNAFWLEDGALAGDNTDVVGVLGAMEALLGGPPRGASILLLGAGGAAAAVVCAAAEAGADRVVLANRSAERARALADRFADAGPCVQARLPAAGERFDLVVNATSLGMRPGDPLPLDPAGAVPVAAALDLVYAAGGTRWIRALAASGVPAADGTEMLVLQAAASFRRWFGRDAPVEAMRAAAAGGEP